MFRQVMMKDKMASLLEKDHSNCYGSMKNIKCSCLRLLNNLNFKNVAGLKHGYSILSSNRQIQYLFQKIQSAFLEWKYHFFPFRSQIVIVLYSLKSLFLYHLNERIQMQGHG